MKDDAALDPRDVGLLGLPAVVAGADGVADAGRAGAAWGPRLRASRARRAWPTIASREVSGTIQAPCNIRRCEPAQPHRDQEPVPGLPGGSGRGVSR
jgi:hypothetical protein